MASPSVGQRQRPLEDEASSGTVVSLPLGPHDRVLEAVLAVVEHRNHIPVERVEAVHGLPFVKLTIVLDRPEVEPARLSHGHNRGVESPKSAVIGIAVEFTLCRGKMSWREHERLLMSLPRSRHRGRS